jgi:hypothetical protein
MGLVPRVPSLVRPPGNWAIVPAPKKENPQRVPETRVDTERASQVRGVGRPGGISWPSSEPSGTLPC